MTAALASCAAPSAPGVVMGEGEGDVGEGEGDVGEGEGEGEGEVGEGEGEGEGDVVAGPARYRQGPVHSPMTPFVVARLSALRAAHPERSDDVFSKIGDSLTVATQYLQCFVGNTDLDGAPLEDTRAFFAAGDAGGSDPFSRVSESATIGWSAFAPLQGDPAPLDVEVDATSPAYATVMFGTNDVGFRDIASYASDMLTLTDHLLARGVIPILSTIPPRDDDAAADANVPRFNLVVRAVAEARQVPFIDIELGLRALDGHGIGPDGVHLEQDPRGACVLDAAGLLHGYNYRNLLELEAIDRVHNGAALDADDAARAGSGTAADPFVVDTLPFTDVRDSSASGTESAVASYPSCGAQDESGPEVTYRLHLDEAKTVHALVLDRGGVDIDIHHIDGGGTCTARNDKEVVVDAAPGDHTFVADTFGGAAQAGEFLVVIYAE